MKKLLTLTAILFVFGISAHAASGDIAGKYYSTDIITTLNGYEIDSINIGGQTLIKAEDMKYFSFGVLWDNDARALSVYETAHPENGAPPTVKKSNYPSGMVLGDYYETDIVTTLDGHEITAYNTGGITYIWAEKMRDFGYEVIWSETDRTLKITSPTRAGFKYDVFLSKGENPSSDPTSGQYYDASKGLFSIKWQDGKITAKGDAWLFGSTLSFDGIKYSIDMGFYQNAGLFYSSTLQDRIKPFVYYSRGEQLADPDSLRDMLNEQVTVTINGSKAVADNVWGGGGSGHVDYYFELTDLPRISRQQLNEIEFTFGDTSGMEEYEIETPDYHKNPVTEIVNSIKSSDEDYLYHSYGMGNNYTALFMNECTSWGNYKETLYIANTETGDVTDELLRLARSVTGYHYDVLHAYQGDMSVDDGGKVYFTCSTAYKKGYFAYDMNTHKFEVLADDTFYLPEIPDTGRKYYVIYREGYRDNRIELAVFDADSALTMNGQILGADGYRNDIKYYLDGDKWVEFERGYERVSNNAAEVIDGNIDVNYTE